jgi:hypothetical protein
MESSPTILVRYSPPTTYDIWPKGTKSHVYAHDSSKEYTVYIQRSSDEEHPLWELTGIDYEL